MATIRRLADALDIPPSELDPRHSPRRRSRHVDLGQMSGVSLEYLRAGLRGSQRAREALIRLTPVTALQAAKGKADSLHLDSVAELELVRCLREFDPGAQYVTEEGTPSKRELGPSSGVTWFIDPVDRSRRLAQWLHSLPDPNLTIEQALRDHPPGELVGANAVCCSFTCVRHGRIVGTGLLDLLGGGLVVACGAFVRRGHVDETPEPEDLALQGDEVVFDPDREGDTSACYLGDPESDAGRQRAEIFTGLGFSLRQLPPPNQRDVGGPGRVLYLCDDPDLNCGRNPAFVLGNGEKIGEWLGWLGFAMFSGQLSAFELSADRLPSRDGVLVAPPVDYSVLRVSEDRHGDPSLHIDVPRLMQFRQPQAYRGSIAVCHRSGYYAASLRAMPNVRELPAR